MNISILDLFILLFFVLAAIHGYKKGLALSLALFIGLVLGIIGAKLFSKNLSDWLFQKWEINLPNLSFVLLFLGIFLVAVILGKVFEKSLEMMFLGWLNKAGGIVFALSKAVILLIILFHYYQKANSTQHWTYDKDFEISICYPYLLKSNLFVKKVLE